MVNQKKSNSFSFLIFLCFVGILLYVLLSKGLETLKKANINILPREDVIEISIIYAPESELYLKDVITKFNHRREKVNRKIVKVIGKSGSSGTIKDSIVNAVNGSKVGNIEKPTIFSPSVSHWLQMVNYETNQEVFDIANSRATANAPVVIAIWESRLNLLRKRFGENIGWEELLKVLNSPNGWRDFGADPNSRKVVYYGHTDPYISSTALSTLMAEFLASAQEVKKARIEKLTKADVQNKAVQSKVQEIENLIRHYSSRTTEFKEYIARGPEYLDFVALEENDLIYINQGKTEYKPPEKLVALYPKEGTYIHEHPFGIVNAVWVSDEQRKAAEIFTNYVLSKEVQEKILENGFRPANTEVPLKYPIATELGVNPDEPKRTLSVPAPETIVAIQQSWNYVKKKAHIYLLIDTSGSMDGDKILRAKEAIQIFANKFSPANEIGLISFNSSVSEVVPKRSLENNRSQIQNGVNELRADGSTALYDGILATTEKLKAESNGGNNKIKAIILLSDGQDTASAHSLREVTEELEKSQLSDNPIFVIPIAYGKDADISALNSIARASKTNVQIGDSGDIQKLFELISSYF